LNRPSHALEPAAGEIFAAHVEALFLVVSCEWAPEEETGRLCGSCGQWGCKQASSAAPVWPRSMRSLISSYCLPAPSTSTQHGARVRSAPQPSRRGALVAPARSALQSPARLPCRVRGGHGKARLVTLAPSKAGTVLSCSCLVCLVGLRQPAATRNQHQ
jgi:hypothetical protein